MTLKLLLSQIWAACQIPMTSSLKKTQTHTNTHKENLDISVRV